MVTAFDRLAKVGPQGWSKEGFYSLSLWHSPRSETLGRIVEIGYGQSPITRIGIREPSNSTQALKDTQWCAAMRRPAPLVDEKKGGRSGESVGLTWIVRADSLGKYLCFITQVQRQSGSDRSFQSNLSMNAQFTILIDFWETSLCPAQAKGGDDESNGAPTERGDLTVVSLLDFFSIAQIHGREVGGVKGGENGDRESVVGRRRNLTDCSTVMIPHTQSLTCNLPPSVLPTIHFPQASVPLSRPTSRAFFKPLKSNRFSIQPLKCSVSVVSDPPQLGLINTQKPLPAEVSRTIVELSSVGTLSILTQEGSPLGFGVRFAVDLNGTPVLCLNEQDTRFSVDRRCSLHVQLEQCGVRTPQCTIQGNVDKPGDRMALRKLCSAWKKRFNEEIEERYIYVIDVERVLQIEDYAEDGVWVSSSQYASAEPDPLRNCAEKIVDEINAHNQEDVYRFCNIYVDLDFQVLDAKMVWVDRLGFDVHLRSVQKDVYEVRIPFPREVVDEKGAKSSFNGMSQLAWEVEKNFHAPELKKVKHLKKIMGTAV
ncbi:Glutamyl-tRNA reductase-binding protein, chloroplastic [Sesamum alatum]|uniref:Glutamyl-tRNA reductase-binding protein, chloroplastic n=1 Tax=Sesamum alatum TaxID=300844 RepID=A0AAE2C984_9LAMI|nr:Glutamyl-tRNA reductase-binding protein, chloroplastic [Sesamum alatum]